MYLGDKMKCFNNENVKKEYKNKIVTIIVGICILLLSIGVYYVREKEVNKKLEAAKDLDSTISMPNNDEKSSYVTINYYMSFANYSNDKNNAYYMVGDSKYLYIIYTNIKDMEKLTEEDLKLGVKFSGVTKATNSDVKKLAIEAYNDEFKEYENFKELYLSDFDSMFGNIYLDTTKTKYALTTGYNAIMILLIFVGLIVFAPSFIYLILFRKRTKKLTLDELSMLDVEMSNPDSKYYKKAHIYLTNNYIVDLSKFNYFNYKDIKWVYTHIQRTNGVKTSESIVINTKDGKNHFVAATNGFKKTKEMYDDIYQTIVAKNPEVRVGYTSDNIKTNNEENKKIRKEKKEQKKKDKESKM